jgi:Uma2 family endonuclease
MVGCDPRDTHRLYLCYPKVLIEVSSDSTERTDRHEKFAAYKTIETLEEYLILSQDQPEATIFRREQNWRAESIKGLDQVLILKSLKIKLPLSAIYQGVAFSRA